MEINPKKFDWSNVSDDFEKMQQISGVAAAFGIIIAIILVLTSRLPYQNTFNIWVTIILVLVFSAVYYLTPAIYANKKYLFLSDIVFILGLCSLIYNSGEQGEVFVIFLIFLIAVDAFMFTSSLFYVVFASLVFFFLGTHFLLGHLTSWGAPERNVLFELYGIISVGVVLRIFARDTISLRRQREELAKRMKQLQSQKREIYLMIDNISEGIIAVDTEKNITFINKGALKLLGIVGAPQKLVGKNIDDILPVASNDGKVSIVENALTKKESLIRDDLRMVKADKTIRIHTNTAPIYDENKKIMGAIVLFRDITAERKLEEQRAEFNAIASHELRTPLTVIEGYLYALQSDKSLRYDRKSREFIKKAYDSAQALLQLSNDILTVIKADENQIKIALEEVELTKVAKEVVAEFSAKSIEKKIPLSVKVKPKLPAIQTDRQKVKEIITNLVENALKFTDKGQVIIEIEEIKDKEMIVTVQDTGVGISKEDQGMIFHKFYRTEDWQTRKTGGTGLGLYIAKTFIERLGGEIWVESEKNKGSRFSFSLPLTKKREKAKDRQLNEFIKSI